MANGKIQCIIEGKSFGKRKQIGRGGNGTVYELMCEDGTCNGNFVVKELHAKYEKRQKRFIKEIKTVCKIQDEIKGILPIVSYSVEEKNMWYVMPKAEKCFEYLERKAVTIQDKVEIAIQLAYIIRSLHIKNIYHRDIKPDNILFLDGMVYLSDFGLVFNDVDIRDTEAGEGLGPYLIRPPELDENASEMSEFSKSDVYLFAKTVWMIIKNDNKGFGGEYNRTQNYYLNKESYGICTFEPIHCMLEEATKSTYEERITIEKCIEYLKEQLLIIKGENIKTKDYMYTEYIQEIICREEASEYSYDEPTTINKILKINVFAKLRMNFPVGITRNSIALKNIFSVGDLNDRMYVFIDELGRELLIKISKITLHKDETITIITESMNTYQDYESISKMEKGFFAPLVGKFAVYEAIQIKCIK